RAGETSNATALENFGDAARVACAVADVGSNMVRLTNVANAMAENRFIDSHFLFSRMMLVRLVALRRVDFVKKGKGTTIFTVHGTLKILATNRTRSRCVLGGHDNST